MMGVQGRPLRGGPKEACLAHPAPVHTAPRGLGHLSRPEGHGPAPPRPLTPGGATQRPGLDWGAHRDCPFPAPVGTRLWLGVGVQLLALRPGAPHAGMTLSGQGRQSGPALDLSHARPGSGRLHAGRGLPAGDGGQPGQGL